MNTGLDGDDLPRKLAILADAAEYDASCASSGASGRNSRDGKGLRSTTGLGISHACAGRAVCLTPMTAPIARRAYGVADYCSIAVGWEPNSGAAMNIRLRRHTGGCWRRSESNSLAKEAACRIGFLSPVAGELQRAELHRLAEFARAGVTLLT